MDLALLVLMLLVCGAFLLVAVVLAARALSRSGNHTPGWVHTGPSWVTPVKDSPAPQKNAQWADSPGPPEVQERREAIDLGDFESRSCRQDALHKPHFWGEAETRSHPYRCPGVEREFFYRDWEREVRQFHPPGPDQIQAARRLLVALDAWEEMPDTAGSRWAIKFLTWLATYETPEPPQASEPPGPPEPPEQ